MKRQHDILVRNKPICFGLIEQQRQAICENCSFKIICLKEHEFKLRQIPNL